MRNEASPYRTMIEWTLSAAAVATIVVVMLAVDTPVRQYMKTTTSSLSKGPVLRIPKPVEHFGRSAWRICMDHQPLAAFAGVACVLVLFMRRMR